MASSIDENAAADDRELGKLIAKKRIPVHLRLQSPDRACVLAVLEQNDWDVSRTLDAVGLLTKDLKMLKSASPAKLKEESRHAKQYVREHREATLRCLSGQPSPLPDHRDSFSLVLSAYSQLPAASPRYYCPTCDANYTRASDLRSHVRDKCEARKHIFICKRCDKTATSREDMTQHIERLHPEAVHGHMYKAIMMLPKKFFGCSHCEESFRELDDWVDHLVKRHHKKEGVNGRGSWSCRVRAGIRGAGLVNKFEDACQRRGLQPDIWTTFTWADEVALQASACLEYGVTTINHRGIHPKNVRSFIAELVEQTIMTESGAVASTNLGGEHAICRAVHDVVATRRDTSSVPRSESLHLAGKAAQVLHGCENALPIRCPSAQGTLQGHQTELQPISESQVYPPEATGSRWSYESAGSGSGHKRNRSSGSAIHPDSTQRACNYSRPIHDSGYYSQLGSISEHEQSSKGSGADHADPMDVSHGLYNNSRPLGSALEGDRASYPPSQAFLPYTESPYDITESSWLDVAAGLDLSDFGMAATPT